MASQISERDRKRGYKITVIAMICACALSLLIIYFLVSKQLSSLYFYALTPILPSGIATHLCWKKLVTKGEERIEGARYGMIASLYSLLFTGLVLLIIFIIFDMIQSPNALIHLKDYIFFKLMLLGYFLIIGSFLVAPIGAITGYLFTKNPDQSVPPNSGQ